MGNDRPSHQEYAKSFEKDATAITTCLRLLRGSRRRQLLLLAGDSWSLEYVVEPFRSDSSCSPLERLRAGLILFAAARTHEVFLCVLLASVFRERIDTGTVFVIVG